MTRFLNLASKALAVVGVLTLMWTAGGMQQASAADGTGRLDCKVATPATTPPSCSYGFCPIFQCCCNTPYYDDTHPAGYCCDISCPPCT